MLHELRQMAIQSEPVLDAMREVPRHEFVPSQVRRFAYHNEPLPIGSGQTISQPYIVAYMTEALAPKGSDKVLEIGTGSGYQAAVLAQLVKKVYSIEIIPELAHSAQERLARLGIDNVHIKVDDGYRGWPEEAPFDKIMVTAAPPKIPQALLDQLRDGGKLIAPVGDFRQHLWLIEKKGAELTRKMLTPVRFVPMTGGADQQ